MHGATERHLGEIWKQCLRALLQNGQSAHCQSVNIVRVLNRIVYTLSMVCALWHWYKGQVEVSPKAILGSESCRYMVHRPTIESRAHCHTVIFCALTMCALWHRLCRVHIRCSARVNIFRCQSVICALWHVCQSVSECGFHCQSGRNQWFCVHSAIFFSHYDSQSARAEWNWSKFRLHI